MEYKYESEDFNDLLFNVHRVPKNISLFSEFPELKRYPEFTVELDPKFNKQRFKILRYIVYNYDKGSPMVKGIDDVVKRKITSAREAGLKPNSDGHFAQWVSKMLGGKIQEINEMIVRYCRLQYPQQYALLVTGNEAYFNILTDMLNRSGESNDPIKAATQKQGLFMKASEMVAKLEVIKNEIFSGDNSNGLGKDLFKVVEADTKRKIRLSPEKMVV